MTNVPLAHLNDASDLKTILSNQRGGKITRNDHLRDIRGCRITEPSYQYFGQSSPSVFLDTSFNNDGRIALAGICEIIIFYPDDLSLASRKLHLISPTFRMICSVAWCPRPGKEHLLVAGMSAGYVFVIDCNAQTLLWTKAVPIQ